MSNHDHKTELKKFNFEQLKMAVSMYEKFLNATNGRCLGYTTLSYDACYEKYEEAKDLARGLSFLAKFSISIPARIESVDVNMRDTWYDSWIEAKAELEVMREKEKIEALEAMVVEFKKVTNATSKIDKINKEIWVLQEQIKEPTSIREIACGYWEANKDKLIVLGVDPTLFKNGITASTMEFVENELKKLKEKNELVSVWAVTYVATLPASIEIMRSSIVNIGVCTKANMVEFARNDYKTRSEEIDSLSFVAYFFAGEKEYDQEKVLRINMIKI
jgi:hypothetical protein